MPIEKGVGLMQINHILSDAAYLRFYKNHWTPDIARILDLGVRA